MIFTFLLVILGKIITKIVKSCFLIGRGVGHLPYQLQKETVRQIILEEKGKHEEKITSEIKQAKDSRKKMWLMIKKLKGNKEIENSESEVYNSDGMILKHEEAVDLMIL